MVSTRSIARREARSWTRFPYEIRLEILQMVLDEHPKASTLNPACEGCSSASKVFSLASVCEEWQDFFERWTFRRLVLDKSSLPTFRTAITRDQRRLLYIHKICLRIELAEYGGDSGSQDDYKLAESSAIIDQ